MIFQQVLLLITKLSEWGQKYSLVHSIIYDVFVLPQMTGHIIMVMKHIALKQKRLIF